MSVQQLQVQEKQQQEHFSLSQCQKAAFASTPPKYSFSATETALETQVQKAKPKRTYWYLTLNTANLF
jgi:hypothetical protein